MNAEISHTSRSGPRPHAWSAGRRAAGALGVLLLAAVAGASAVGTADRGAAGGVDTGPALGVDTGAAVGVDTGPAVGVDTGAAVGVEAGRAGTADRGAAADRPSAYLYAIGGQDGPGTFTDPTRIEVTSDGSVLVADAASHRVQAFDGEGAFAWALGAAGDADGRFCAPGGMAEADDGTLFVGDVCLGRLQLFDAGRRFQAGWDRYGLPGRPGSRFFHPVDAAASDDGSVWVADGLDNVILRFDRDGSLADSWGGAGTGPGRFVRLTAVAAGPGGRVYAGDGGGEGRVQAFDAYGALVAGWATGPAEDVAVSADSVYVAGGTAFGLARYGLDGRPLGRVPLGIDLGPGAPGLRNVRSVGVRGDGSVFVLDAADGVGTARVVHLDAGGRYLASWSSGAPGVGAMDPSAVSADPAGALYVADEPHDRVQVFAPDGLPRAVWPGAGESGIASPSGVSVDADGTVFVADSGGHRVLRFSSAGQMLSSIGSGPGTALGKFGEAGPSGLSCIHPASSMPQFLYAADPSNTRVQAFDRDGRPQLSFGSVGSGDGEFAEGAVGDIATAANGNVYVTDRLSARQRVQVFGYDGRFQFAFDGRVGEDSRFVPLQAVAVGPEGSVYLSDPRSRIQLYTPDGSFLDEWDTYASRPDMAIAPGDLAAVPGRLYVADRVYGLVHVFGTSRPASWRVELYASPWLAGPLAAVEEPADLDLSWGEAAPAPGLPPDGFSLRAYRFFELPDGEIRMSAEVDGGVRVWLDDRLVLDAWEPSRTTHFVARRAAAGEHLVQVEYFDDAGDALLALDIGADVPTLTPSPTLAATYTPTPTRTLRPTRIPPTLTPTATVTVESSPSAAPTDAPPGRTIYLPFAQQARSKEPGATSLVRELRRAGGAEPLAPGS